MHVKCVSHNWSPNQHNPSGNQEIMLICGPIDFVVNYLMHLIPMFVTINKLDCTNKLGSCSPIPHWLKFHHPSLLPLDRMTQCTHAHRGIIPNIHGIQCCQRWFGKGYVIYWWLKIYANNIVFGRRKQPQYSSNCTNSVPRVQPIWGMQPMSCGYIERQQWMLCMLSQTKVTILFCYFSLHSSFIWVVCGWVCL